MTAARFQPGDRVRARFSTPLLPAGTPGTVMAVYPTIRHAYEVRFDGQLASKLQDSLNARKSVLRTCIHRLVKPPALLAFHPIYAPLSLSTWMPFAQADQHARALHAAQCQ